MRTEPDERLAPVTLVIPCYNEERRLDTPEILRLSRTEGVRVLLVDDGSGDGTARILEDLCARSAGRASWFRLARNQGKGEAVRRGLLQALADRAEVVGFLDADLSTPVDEILRLVTFLRAHPDTAVILAARIRLLGHGVQRQAVRHYLGRAFATAASLTLDLQVYDTQCGAKLFRDTRALRAALARPFLSRWIFDVELLGRLVQQPLGLAPSAFAEVPLLVWRDVAGSKLKPHHMLCAIAELYRIHQQRKCARTEVVS